MTSSGAGTNWTRSRCSAGTDFAEASGIFIHIAPPVRPSAGQWLPMCRMPLTKYRLSSPRRTAAWRISLSTHARNSPKASRSPRAARRSAVPSSPGSASSPAASSASSRITSAVRYTVRTFFLPVSYEFSFAPQQRVVGRHIYDQLQCDRNRRTMRCSASNWDGRGREERARITGEEAGVLRVD